MKRSILTFAISGICILGYEGSISSQVVSAGNYHSLFVCQNSVAMACGGNYYGQLGRGTTSSPQSIPMQVNSLNNIKSVDPGYEHSMFLKNDGTVWGCGLNSDGQLGDGTTVNKSTPVQINSLSNIIAVSAGLYHTLFLKGDGTVWSCGQNVSGQLGDGTTIGKTTPVQIMSLSNVRAISAGQYHSLFLISDSTVWGCGFNNGCLGDASAIQRSTPVKVKQLTKIIAISAFGHSLFLKSDSTVWACGDNFAGQLGNGTTNSTSLPMKVNLLGGVSSIAAGGSHSLFLRNDGKVLSCGYNYSGQLGNGTTSNSALPTIINSISDIKAISAGKAVSFFVSNNGGIFACGLNDQGQLGDGTIIDKVAPIQTAGACLAIEGIDEHEGIENLEVFPNPSTGTIVIKKINYEFQKCKIDIFSTLGICLYSKEFSEDVTNIEISDRPKGLYYLRVSIGNQILDTKKIILE